MNFSFFLFYFDCILPGAKVAVASQSWSRQPTKLTRRPFLPFANNNNNNSKKKRETNNNKTHLIVSVCLSRCFCDSVVISHEAYSSLGQQQQPTVSVASAQKKSLKMDAPPISPPGSISKRYTYKSK
jgi:hypothetical protein